MIATPVHKNRRHGCRGSGQILKPWLYKVVDKEVRMHILENLLGELTKVEDGLVSCEHNVKGHFFRGMEMRRLKSSVFGKFDKIR